jgi:hypothetical protein
MIQTVFEQITGRAEVQQDRLEITDDDTDATLYVKQKYRDTPLGKDETHVEIKLVTENSTTQIALDGEQMNGVIDALYSIQQAYQENQEVLE